ncbi:MAG TPA: pyruvate kinase [Acidimicrobiales bacterium]
MIPPETLAEQGPRRLSSDPLTLYGWVRDLRDAVAVEADQHQRGWRTGEPTAVAIESWFGAANLAAYLALRGHDVREVQAALADLGLSSLGRCEAHVLPTLDAIIAMLGRALAVEQDGTRSSPTSISEAAAAGRSTLQRNSSALFGSPLAGRHARIMVTLPTEAAEDAGYVRALVATGMDCARINCGHDTPELWVRMAANVRAAAAETGRSCSVLMDLSGPRLRTGPIGPGPAVVRVHPRRDAVGDVTEPGRLILDGTGAAGSSGRRGVDARVSVDSAWVAGVEVGDTVVVTDLPGRRRTLSVVDAPGPLERTCESTAGCFLGPGLELHHHPAGRRPASTALIGAVEPSPAEVRVVVGDELILSRDTAPGRPPVHADGSVIEPARIPIGVPEAVDHLRPGHRVFIDGGAIAAVVDRVDSQGAHLIIESAKPRGSRIKADKGLNFPDTDLPLPSLTAEDLVALDTVVANADAVGYSFVRRAEDVDVLVEELARRGERRIAILAKIETADGVANLPEIIVRGGRRHPFGVMIARGDLAIEIGYQRLADVQEEILWICEAAHVPAVWATQVLERLVHTGVPTRAEITDAAAAEGAECVMLNKGPFLLEGVEVLHDLLRRTAPRHDKKTDLLPVLDLGL